jgi:hypothetical protein
MRLSFFSLRIYSRPVNNRLSFSTSVLALSYMPAYELFLDGVRSSSQSWTGRSIALRLGQERQVLGMEEF